MIRLKYLMMNQGINFQPHLCSQLSIKPSFRNSLIPTILHTNTTTNSGLHYWGAQRETKCQEAPGAGEQQPLPCQSSSFMFWLSPRESRQRLLVLLFNPIFSLQIEALLDWREDNCQKPPARAVPLSQSGGNPRRIFCHLCPCPSF